MLINLKIVVKYTNFNTFSIWTKLPDPKCMFLKNLCAWKYFICWFFLIRKGKKIGQLLRLSSSGKTQSKLWRQVGVMVHFVEVISFLYIFHFLFPCNTVRHSCILLFSFYQRLDFMILLYFSRENAYVYNSSARKGPLNIFLKGVWDASVL